MFLYINNVGATEAAELMTDGELVGVILGVVVVLVVGVTAAALLVIWFVDFLPQ